MSNPVASTLVLIPESSFIEFKNLGSDFADSGIKSGNSNIAGDKIACPFELLNCTQSGSQMT